MSGPCCVSKGVRFAWEGRKDALNSMFKRASRENVQVQINVQIRNILNETKWQATDSSFCMFVFTACCL